MFNQTKERIHEDRLSFKPFHRRNSIQGTDYIAKYFFLS